MKIIFIFLLLTFTNSLMARGNKDKLFNLAVGGTIGLTEITTEENFRFFPGEGALADNSLKNYDSGGDASYSWLIVVENNIKWIPNYKFERWYNNTTSGTGGTQDFKQIKNNQDMHYFWYSPVNTEIFFLDVGTIYTQNHMLMNSHAQPTGKYISQDKTINNFMAYFNLGFDIKGFIPSFSLGLPTSLTDTMSMFSVKMAYNFIRAPVDAQIYLGYDHYKYNFTDNTDLYGQSHMNRIYLGATIGGGF